MRANTTVRPTRWTIVSYLCLTGVVLLSLPLRATQANYRLCFTQVVGLPITNQNQPPTIDGLIVGDPGWTQAFRYEFGNGTGYPKGAVQGIKDATFLYLSVEIHNDATYDNSDLIVLVLSPSGGVTGTDDRRIHIYPNQDNTNRGNNVLPTQQKYWTYSASSASWTPATLPLAFAAKVKNEDQASGGVSWFVEMKIPITDFNIPSSGTFGLYFDVITVNGNTGTAKEYYWPPRDHTGIGGNGVGAITPETGTPSSLDWGNGTIDPLIPCNGVSLSWNDITSNHPPDQIFAKPTDHSNYFTATPRNNSVGLGPGPTPSPSPITAKQVRAKFSIANFGLSNNWTPIPVGNPAGTAPPQDLPANCGPCLPGLTTQSTPWDITDSGLIANFATHPDQCILVEFDVPQVGACISDPNQCVTFINKSFRRNMWVLTASAVSKTAEISAKGYPLPMGGRNEQEFELHVLSQTETLDPSHGSSDGTFSRTVPKYTTKGERGGVLSRLNWGVEGCRLTGRYIIILQKKYELCDDIGAFGAIVDHHGTRPVKQWYTSLEGSGLSKVKDAKDTYRLLVPVDSVAPVTVRFEPKEAKWAAFLDAGGNIPHTTFANGFDHGFSLNAGLEYTVNSYVSAEGIFGYHHFPAKSVLVQSPNGPFVIAAPDQNIYHLSANAKIYLSPPHSVGSITVRPFANGGPGLYKFSSGPWKLGGNIGIGGLFELTSRFGLQASYHFHTVNTSGAATKFSTLQGGIRFVF